MNTFEKLKQTLTLLKNSSLSTKEKSKQLRLLQNEIRYYPGAYIGFISRVILHGNINTFKTIVENDESILNKSLKMFYKNSLYQLTTLEACLLKDKTDLFHYIYTHKQTNMVLQLQFSENLLNLFCRYTKNIVLIKKYITHIQLQRNKTKDKFDKKGNNWIHNCCKNGSLALLQYLKKQLKITNKELNSVTKTSLKETGFTIACEQGHLNIVRFLVKNKVKNSTNSRKLNGMHLAIIQKHTDIVEFLASTTDYSMKKSDITHQPLLLAITSNDPKITKILIEAGYKIRDSGLHHNFRLSGANVNTLKLAFSKLPELRTQFHSYSVLINCMLRNSIPLIKLILENFIPTMLYPTVGRPSTQDIINIKNNIKKFNKTICNIKLKSKFEKNILLYLITSVYKDIKTVRTSLLDPLHQFIINNEVSYEINVKSMARYFFQMILSTTESADRDKIASIVYASPVYVHLHSCIQIISVLNQDTNNILAVDLNKMLQRVNVLNHIAKKYRYLPSLLHSHLEQAYRIYRNYKLLTATDINFISPEKHSQLQNTTKRLDLYIKFLIDRLELTIENGEVKSIKKKTANTVQSAQDNGKKRSHSETQITQDKNTPTSSTNASAKSSSRKKIKIEPVSMSLTM
jgi:ankyrin repeat protein